MDDPAALRMAMALLLLICAWFVALWWFNPTAWAVAALLSVVAIWAAPSPP